jgi:hypothetical protein
MCQSDLRGLGTIETRPDGILTLVDVLHARSVSRRA